jgi:hypothetical protein
VTVTFPPKSVPELFVFRREVQGPEAPGFHGKPDHTAFVYTRGYRHADWAFPYSVHFTSANTELDCTESNAGVPVQLSGGRVATYHDGMWGGPPASLDQEPPWDMRYVHSLTLRLTAGTIAVRAPKEWATIRDMINTLQSCIE